MLDNISKLDDKYILVLLDIKGGYRDDVKGIESDRLIYIDHEVDFLALLAEIDIYVRPTTRDGSSVAVQEALMLGKKVLASDVVERPAEVTLYKSGDFTDFKEKLEHIKETEGFTPNSIDDYLAFCNQLLEN
jgi:glycosyltransferase involved in cell wall biosynthesis